MTVSVGTLEPANEVAIVEIETQESGGHASYPGFVGGFVGGWGWSRFQQVVYRGGGGDQT